MDFRERYRALRAGDREVLGGLLLEMERPLRAFLEARMGSELRRFTDPPDVSSEIFLTIVEQVERWPSDLREDEFQAYLFQIAHRRMVDALRRNRRLRGESSFPEPAAGSGGGTGRVTHEDDRAMLHQGIHRLPAIYAQVLKRCIIEGRSVDAAAQDLGVTKECAKKRLTRGRKLLLELIEAESRSP